MGAKRTRQYSITQTVFNYLEAAGHTIMRARVPSGRLVIYRIDNQVFSGAAASQREARDILSQMFEDYLLGGNN